MRPAELPGGPGAGSGAQPEVRPIRGNPASGRLRRGPGCNRTYEVCDDICPADPAPGGPGQSEPAAPRVAFSRHVGIYRSDGAWIANLGWRRVLPSRDAHPGPRTCREDHALLIVSMSSGRLFLDRVARQHCPSPLHRHAQTNTSFLSHPRKGDVSTLRKRVTFLLCVDIFFRILYRIWMAC